MYDLIVLWRMGCGLDGWTALQKRYVSGFGGII